jgi:hypothetical protein
MARRLIAHQGGVVQSLPVIIALTAGCLGCHAQEQTAPVAAIGLVKPGYVVLKNSASADVGVLVSYRPEEDGGGSCEVVIYDHSAQPSREIASGLGLIECIDADPQSAAKQLQLAVGSSRITLRRIKAVGSESFALDRDAAGTWRVSEATYIDPETDPATGDVVVVQKRAVFEKGGPALGEFSYERVEPRLVRTEIK